MDATSLIDAATRTADQYSGSSILQAIFGPGVADPLGMLSITSAPAATPLAAMFGIFNLGIMAIASIFVTYTMLSAVVQTAHEGEFIGKRFDTVWVPIRLLIGIGSMVPAFGGWAFCQILMIWFSAMGSGIGNLVWSGAVDFVARGGQLVSVSPTPQDRQVVDFMARSAICRASAVAGYYQAMSGELTPTAADDGGSVSFGWSGKAQCGSVAIPSASLHVAAAHRAALHALDARMMPHAEQHVQASMIDVPDASSPARPDWQAILPRLASQYRSDLEALLATATATERADLDALTAAMVRDAEGRGWTSAGTWYTQLAGVGSKAAAVRAARPEVTQPVSQPDDIHFAGMSSAYTAAAGSYSIAMRSDKAGTSGVWDKIGGAFGCDAGGLGPCIVGQITGGGSSQSALLRMHTLGDYVATGGLVAIPVVGGIKGAAEAVSDGFLAKGAATLLPGAGDAARGALKGAAEAVGDTLLLSLRALVVAGIFLSTYLPLLPAIIWIAGIITWVIVCCEAAAAAPLWAMTHLDTDGEGMGGKTQHGYLFIVNVLFRPTLMVFGFVVASIVVDVAGGFWTSIFGQAVASAQADSMTGLVSIVAFVIIYCLVCVSIVSLSFNAIFELPNAVLMWLGGQMTAELGKGAESSVTHDFRAGAGGAVAGISARGGRPGKPPNEADGGARKGG